MAEPIILCDTAGMSRERWLECRAHGPDGDIPYTVGGSDVPIILGYSPWSTPLELWRIKKGLMKVPKKDNEKQLALGHRLEDIAADLYAERTGDTVINDTNFYQHADIPYALANFDRRFIRKKDGAKGILECKSTNYHKADAWANDAYPIYYEYQLRFYLAVADVENGAFAAWWGNNPDTDFATPTITRDRRKENWMLEKIDEFVWSLKNDKPPTMEDIAPKTALESLARIYERSDPSLPLVKIPSVYEKGLRKIATLQAEISKHDAEARKLRKEASACSVEIAELMKLHERGELVTGVDKLLVDYITTGRRGIDDEKLKTEYPEVYEAVRKTSYSRNVKVRVEAI